MINNLCPNCKSEGIFKLTPELKHYGRLDCPNCGRWIKFVGKPSDESERKETTKINLTYDYCRMCGRTKHNLGDKETIEAHHLTPLEDGGLDELENLILLCTPCHRMFHFMRLYLNKHLQRYYEAKN